MARQMGSFEDYSFTEPAAGGHRDMPFGRSHVESLYQRCLRVTVPDLDRGAADPGAAYPPRGQNYLGLMLFEPSYDQFCWLRDPES